MYWGVRESFVKYVLCSPDGQIFGDDGIETNGEGIFRFPVETDICSDTHWVIQCEGVAQFVAHMGMLNLAISRPRLSVGPGGGELAVDGPSGQRIVIADVEAKPPRYVSPGFVIFPRLRAALTEVGAEHFGGSYEPGSELSDVSVLLQSAEYLTGFKLWLEDGA